MSEVNVGNYQLLRIIAIQEIIIDVCIILQK